MIAPTGLSPDATAQLRRLLELAPDAGDDEILEHVIARLRLADAALEVGFTKAFNSAVAGGRVDVTRHVSLAEPPTHVVNA